MLLHLVIGLVLIGLGALGGAAFISLAWVASRKDPAKLQKMLNGMWKDAGGVWKVDDVGRACPCCGWREDPSVAALRERLETPPEAS